MFILNKVIERRNPGGSTTCSFVYTTQKLFATANIASVIMSPDGIWNTGSDWLLWRQTCQMDAREDGDSEDMKLSIPSRAQLQ